MRARLTLLYGGMFLLAGGVLIGIFYVIFTSNFPGGHLADGILGPKGITPRLPPDLDRKRWNSAFQRCPRWPPVAPTTHSARGRLCWAKRRKAISDYQKYGEIAVIFDLWKTPQRRSEVH